MIRNAKTRRNSAFAIRLSTFVVLSAVAAANAQSGGGYVITKSTIDSGGGTVSGGAYRTSGTVGQHEASDLTGGNYVVNGGFWNERQITELIPTVSEWGVAMIALALAIAASMILTSRHRERQRCEVESG